MKKIHQNFLDIIITTHQTFNYLFLIPNHTWSIVPWILLL
jgi:hypothetical protein